MTIPTLISSYRKKEYSVRLKRFYSTMQQAIQLSSIDNGDPKNWNYPTSGSSPEIIMEFWNTYFGQYFKSVAKVNVRESDSVIIVYFLDGSKLTMQRSGVINLYYDVNGDSPPDEAGVDNYTFLLRIYKNNNAGRFSPYDWQDDIKPDDEEFTKDMADRENVLKLCKKSRAHCSQLLMLDNWEFKDDYPFKI